MIESSDENGIIMVIFLVNYNMVEFKIEDMGCGILVLYLDKLFNFFFIMKFEG